MPVFYTLKYAIYFIVPAVVLFVAAYVFGGVLTLTARTVVERDVSHDSATRTMAFVLTATAGVVAFVFWATQVLWAAVAAGTAASFFVGAFVYSLFVEGFAPRDRGGPVAPIGLPKGSLISAIITLCGLALTLLVLWAARRPP